MKNRLKAFTLIETLISILLMSIISMITLFCLNAILKASYLISARTSVRDNSEFAIEFIKRKLKNANPHSISCTETNNPDGTINQRVINWSPLIGSETYSLYLKKNTNNNSLIFVENIGGPPHEIVLTYEDVNIKDFDIINNCSNITPYIDNKGVAHVLVEFSFTTESVLKWGKNKPAVGDVKKYVAVLVSN